MNQYGLMFDGTFVPKIGPDRDLIRKNGLKAAPVHLFKNILKTCKSIEEAEGVINRYFIPYIKSAQILLVDAQGGYLVVKANGVSEKGYVPEGSFKVITNFHLEDLETGEYTCYRYDLAQKIFTESFDNSLAQFEDVLSQVHQSYPGATVYSNIYNLTSASSTFYYNARFDRKITLDFKGDMPETPVMVEEIFEKRMINHLIKAYKSDGIPGIEEAFTDAMNFAEDSRFQTDVQQLLDMGEYLYRQEDLSGYQQVLSLAAKHDPGNDRVWEAQGISQLRFGNIDTALSHFQQALQINSQNYWANRLLKTYGRDGICKLTFSLPGYENARSVMLFGNFNEWRGYDNTCVFENGRWNTCVYTREKTLRYRFKVDGQWVGDVKQDSTVKLESGLKVFIRKVE